MSLLRLPLIAVAEKYGVDTEDLNTNYPKHPFTELDEADASPKPTGGSSGSGHADVTTARSDLFPTTSRPASAPIMSEDEYIRQGNEGFKRDSSVMVGFEQNNKQLNAFKHPVRDIIDANTNKPMQRNVVGTLIEMIGQAIQTPIRYERCRPDIYESIMTGDYNSLKTMVNTQGNNLCESVKKLLCPSVYAYPPSPDLQAEPNDYDVKHYQEIFQLDPVMLSATSYWLLSMPCTRQLVIEK